MGEWETGLGLVLAILFAACRLRPVAFLMVAFRTRNGKPARMPP